MRNYRAIPIGKELRAESFVFGSLIIDGNQIYIIRESPDLTLRECSYMSAGEKEWHIDPYCVIEVIPETVGQAIGKENLYEGDLVKHDNHVRPVGFFEIEWDEYKAGWVLSGIGKDKAMWLRDWSADFVEVIGNRYTHPELLEKP